MLKGIGNHCGLKGSWAWASLLARLSMGVAVSGAPRGYKGVLGALNAPSPQFSLNCKLQT